MTTEELIEWLKQEVFDITKAAQLRVSDATDFVTARLSNRISPEEVEERYRKYQARWREPIPGALTYEGITDRQILAQLDGLNKADEEMTRRAQKLKDSDLQR